MNTLQEIIDRRLQDFCKLHKPTATNTILLTESILEAFQAGKDTAVEYIEGMSAYKPGTREQYSREKKHYEVVKEKVYQVWEYFLQAARNA